MANKLDYISIKNATTVFGVRREAGTMIYDENAEKAYFLTANYEAGDTLTTATSKTEM